MMLPTSTHSNGLMHVATTISSDPFARKNRQDRAVMPAVVDNFAKRTILALQRDPEEALQFLRT